MGYNSPLPVRLSTSSSVWERGTASVVPSNVETTVLTYSITDAPLFLDEINVTGDFAAEFRIYFNEAHKETKRIGVANPVETLRLHGFRAEIGHQVVVKVVHTRAGGLQNFEATLRGHR